jgi:cell division inhibitor SepF
MAGALRKTMVYLGLAEEDEHDASYDEYADSDEHAGQHGTGASPGGQNGHAREGLGSSHGGGAHALRPEEMRSMREEHSAGVTRLPQRTPVARVVREPEVGALNRISTVHPRTYNEAKNIGESFREGIPVIMNLTDMNDADAKRLVDFAAGLVFGLHGAIERVTSKVFLLSPAYVEVTAEDAEARPARLFNQS